MAKTIKFNLIVDGHPARTLEELREHFNIEDVLEAYRNGLLLRWLQVREYRAQAEQVAALSEPSPLKLANELISIFEMGADQEHVQKILRVIELKRKHSQILNELHQKQFERDKVITTYHQEYARLVKSLKPELFIITSQTVDTLANQCNSNFAGLRKCVDKTYSEMFELFTDVKEAVGESYVNAYSAQILRYVEKTSKKFGTIKATFNDIFWHYRQLLAVDLEHFYNYFFYNEPLVLMAFLMNKEALHLLLEHPAIQPQLIQLSEPNFLNRLPIRICKDVTAPYWKDIEPTGTEYLILRIEQGANFVRNLGKQGEHLSYLDVNGKFPILDGIDYKSDNANHKLVYLPCSPENPFWTGARSV